MCKAAVLNTKEGLANQLAATRLWGQYVGEEGQADASITGRVLEVWKHLSGELRNAGMCAALQSVIIF